MTVYIYRYIHTTALYYCPTEYVTASNNLMRNLSLSVTDPPCADSYQIAAPRISERIEYVAEKRCFQQR